MIKVTVGDVLDALSGAERSDDAVPLLNAGLRLLAELLYEDLPPLKGEDLRVTDDERARLLPSFGEYLDANIREKPVAILNLLRAWDGRSPEQEDTDVHTEHCCRLHGCKYGDLDCPVETGVKAQTSWCEDCDR